MNLRGIGWQEQEGATLGSSGLLDEKKEQAEGVKTDASLQQPFAEQAGLDLKEMASAFFEENPIFNGDMAKFFAYNINGIKALMLDTGGSPINLPLAKGVSQHLRFACNEENLLAIREVAENLGTAVIKNPNLTSVFIPTAFIRSFIKLDSKNWNKNDFFTFFSDELRSIAKQSREEEGLVAFKEAINDKLVKKTKQAEGNFDNQLLVCVRMKKLSKEGEEGETLEYFVNVKNSEDLAETVSNSSPITRFIHEGFEINENCSIEVVISEIFCPCDAYDEQNIITQGLEDLGTFKIFNNRFGEEEDSLKTKLNTKQANEAQASSLFFFYPAGQKLNQD